MFAKTGLACRCADYYEPDFYKNVLHAKYYCLAVFDTFEYIQELSGQRGYFKLIDTVGDFDSVIWDFNSTIGDTIVIEGQNGFNCGEGLNKFSLGDTLFLALSNGYHRNYEKDTFYLPGLCGKYYQKITNGQNDGLSIGEIKDKIESIILTDKLGLDYERESIIFPNPATDFVTIASLNNLISNVEIYDISGEFIASIDTINNHITDIDISNFKAGLYTIFIYTDNNSRISGKILKE